MLSNKSTVQFNGTKEQEKELLDVIHGLKDEKGALMPIMQKAQDICLMRCRRLFPMRRRFRWRRFTELQRSIHSSI